MDETKGYPKLQWSVFVKNGKDTQYVVRADSIEEFERLQKFVLAKVGEILIEHGANIQTHSEAVAVTSTPSLKAICQTCGSPAAVKSGNKNGKAWSGVFCTVEKSHVRWG